MNCNPDEAKRKVFVIAPDTEKVLDKPWHSHERAQLIHASEGVLTVHTHDGLWVVPPQRAVWVPPGVEHKVSSRKHFQLVTLFTTPDLIKIPKQCCVVNMSPLVRELLKEAAKFTDNYELNSAEERLVQVILDQLPHAKVKPLSLVQPRDVRLKKIAEALEANLAETEPLEKMAAEAGLTSRNAARLFVKETGMTFGQWRQQLRLLTALEHLGADESVTNVAIEVGYNDVSSFISMFKSAMGETPAKYFR